jgi:hypothetical protein
MKRTHYAMMLFATIALACTSKPGSVHTGGPAGGARAGDGQSVRDSASPARPQMVVRLIDGSRIVGRAMRQDIPFRTTYMNVNLEYKLLTSMEFSAGEPGVTANMENGDRIKGTIAIDALELETLVGTVSVPFGTVASIRVIHATPGATAGLAAFYPLHGSAEDQSGHGRHGVLHGPTPTADHHGIANAALLFDGAQTYIQIPDGLFGPTTDGFTVSAWVLTHNAIARGMAIYTGTRMGESQLQVIDGNFVFLTKLSNGAWHAAQAPAVQDNFAHLVGVYRRGISLQLWVNGERKAETPLPQYGLYPGPPPVSSSIGSYAPELLNYVWQGAIEDVHIYDRALTDQEIHEMYDSGK